MASRTLSMEWPYRLQMSEQSIVSEHCSLVPGMRNSRPVYPYKNDLLYIQIRKKRILCNSNESPEDPNRTNSRNAMYLHQIYAYLREWTVYNMTLVWWIDHLHLFRKTRTYDTTYNRNTVLSGWSLSDSDKLSGNLVLVKWWVESEKCQLNLNGGGVYKFQKTRPWKTQFLDVSTIIDQERVNVLMELH
jgi:hypothetical protein